MTMNEAVRIGKFREAMGAAAAWLLDAPVREATVVHHNDTDGITSGAILRKSLTRAGFAVENIPIERVHPAFLPAIHTSERRLILYADLGGQSARAIGSHIRDDSRVLILDHHLPAPGEFPRLLQVNPELFGIDGDMECAAATAAWFFAMALNSENGDLADLAVLGAAGDRQITEGRCTGPNGAALETALARGALMPGGDAGAPWLLPRLGDRSLREADEWLTLLAVNGYYRRGADLALAVCLEGTGERTAVFSAEMAELQQERFGRELEAIRATAIARCDGIAWVDVGERFYPLGLKAIGLFLETLIRGELVGAEDYVVGFQRFPEENPYLGRFAGGETKVSFRVSPGLKQRIERGEKPDLMRLVPGAVVRVGGFAEACHRYSAASTIPEGRKGDLLRLLSERAAGEC